MMKSQQPGIVEKVDRFKILVPIAEKYKRQSSQGNIYLASYNEEIVIIKVFIKDQGFFFEKEFYQILSKSDKIINAYPIEGAQTLQRIDSKFKSTQPEIKKRNVLVMEYYEKSMLFHYIEFLNARKKQTLSPPTCRKLIRMIIEGVRELDQNGIGHRDLKLQNIMVNNEFKLKIFDFGHSRRSKDKDNNYIVFQCEKDKKIQFGTRTFHPPEVKEGQEFTLIEYDVYSIGIILFLLYTRMYPFSSSKIDFQELFKKKNTVFWENIEKKGFLKIEESFKTLMNCFLSPNKNERPTLEKLKKYKEEYEWFHGQESSNQQVQKQMGNIFKYIKNTISFKHRANIIQDIIEQFGKIETNLKVGSNRGSVQNQLLEFVEDLDINLETMEQVDFKFQQIVFPVEEDFVEIATFSLKRILDEKQKYSDKQEQIQDWKLQANENGNGFVLERQDKKIVGKYRKYIDSKIYFCINFVNFDLLEQEGVEHTLNDILGIIQMLN